MQGLDSTGEDRDENLTPITKGPDLGDPDQSTGVSQHDPGVPSPSTDTCQEPLPGWVRLCVSGAKYRERVLFCLFVLLLLGVASLILGFRDRRFWAGLILLPGVLHYFLAIRWMDRHKRWSDLQGKAHSARKA